MRHHVALSVVGTDRLQQSGYFRAKQAQDRVVSAGGIPYTIVQTTQFFEFVDGIARSAGDGPVLRLSSAWVQPISSDDVAAAMYDAALAPPVNGVVEIAGPDRFQLDQLVGRFLRAKGDQREVMGDSAVPYFGAVLEPGTLVPAGQARLGAVHFDSWLSGPA